MNNKCNIVDYFTNETVDANTFMKSAEKWLMNSNDRFLKHKHDGKPNVMSRQFIEKEKNNIERYKNIIIWCTTDLRKYATNVKDDISCVEILEAIEFWLFEAKCPIELEHNITIPFKRIEKGSYKFILAIYFDFIENRNKHSLFLEAANYWHKNCKNEDICKGYKWHLIEELFEQK